MVIVWYVNSIQKQFILSCLAFLSVTYIVLLHIIKVPAHYADNPPLGRWVSTQRKYFKMYNKGDKSRITKEKIKQLSDIGFVWNRWEQNWSDNGTFNNM